MKRDVKGNILRASSSSLFNPAPSAEKTREDKRAENLMRIENTGGGVDIWRPPYQRQKEENKNEKEVHYTYGSCMS